MDIVSIIGAIAIIGFIGFVIWKCAKKSGVVEKVQDRIDDYVEDQ